MKGGSYIGLPKILKDKKFAVNIKNKDDMCLPWHIGAEMYPPSPGKNLYRPSSYPDPKTVLNLDGVNISTHISQITKI